MILLYGMLATTYHEIPGEKRSYEKKTKKNAE